ncbi:unnamed protein product [Linum tenue]|uniref:Uncharacterized protein n=1 Tax=Linum tenue TaxID=586396 RepID=A0AAV0QTN8_9ROSI|nr:unnamed protein product [Linum tenue]
MAKRLIPAFNRILVEKIVPPSKTTAGILLPEKTSKLNSCKVVVVGFGLRDKSGNQIPVAVKEGQTVLLPEYGGTEVKLGDKELTSQSPRIKPKLPIFALSVAAARSSREAQPSSPKRSAPIAVGPILRRPNPAARVVPIAVGAFPLNQEAQGLVGVQVSRSSKPPLELGK